MDNTQDNKTAKVTKVTKVKAFHTSAFTELEPDKLMGGEETLYSMVAKKLKSLNDQLTNAKEQLENEVLPFLSECKTRALKDRQDKLNERIENINSSIDELKAKNLQTFSSQNVACTNLRFLRAQQKRNEARELHGEVYGNNSVYQKLSTTKRELVDRFVVGGDLPSIDLTMTKTKQGEVFTASPLKGTETKSVTFEFKLIKNKKGKKKTHLIIKD
jgi:TolA-binding protein